MTVYIDKDTRSRIRYIRHQVNRLLTYKANGCKELFNREELIELQEMFKETRRRIHTQKMKAPIKALIKGDYNF